MNKYEKDILELETHCLQKEDCGFIYGTYIPFVENKEYSNAVKSLNKLVELATPKKVIHLYGEYETEACPNCNSYLGHNNKFCHNCLSKNIKHISGHLNIILDDVLITILAATCKDCLEKCKSTRNPIGTLKSGYYGDWNPKMGIRNLSKRAKYHKKIMKLINDYENNKIKLVNL